MLNIEELQKCQSSYWTFYPVLHTHTHTHTDTHTHTYIDIDIDIDTDIDIDVYSSKLSTA